MVGGLCRGATLVTMRRFDLEQCLRAIERYRVTCTVVPPPVVVALAKHPSVDDHDLSSLRLIISGGAPLGAEAQQACAARLGCRVAQGWGMTELAGAGSVSPPPELAADEPGTVGWCVAGGEMRIVDPRQWRRAWCRRAWRALVPGAEHDDGVPAQHAGDCRDAHRRRLVPDRRCGADRR
jgi:acyl-coenzyme A synthetase/AMP-(fatty) acid ligase